MLFELTSLISAVSDEFGAFFGAKVSHVFRAVTGIEPRKGTQVTGQDVGKILALLLVPDVVPACGPKVADLALVTLELGERELDFEPEKAKDHKLFGAWVGSTLADSLALAFTASADLSIAAATAPRSMRWNVGGIGSTVSAECIMEFPTSLGGSAVVIATYGATHKPAGLLSLRTLDGDQLARVAAFTCDMTRAVNADAAAVEAAAEAATLH